MAAFSGAQIFTISAANSTTSYNITSETDAAKISSMLYLSDKIESLRLAMVGN
jgi:hypothetical protein